MLYNNIYNSELKKLYMEIVSDYFVKKLSYNIMCVPKIKKVVLNMSLGFRGENNIYLSECFNELYSISLQKPIIIKSKKSISNFFIREGNNIAIKTTLRGNNMYDFLNKFINISLPRIKNFDGLGKDSFDDMGNYNIGISDHNIFPEIFLLDKITKPKGMDINITIFNKNPKDSFLLLSKLGFPFK